MNNAPSDRINKAAWTLAESIKDTLMANVSLAMRTNQLDIKHDQLAKLLAIVNVSVDEGFHKGSRVFGRVVDDATADVAGSTKKKSR